jgi:hypothetical protein
VDVLIFNFEPIAKSQLKGMGLTVFGWKTARCFDAFLMSYKTQFAWRKQKFIVKI